MSVELLRQRIEDAISSVRQHENSIIVLKGISVSAVEPDLAKKIDLDQLTTNKLQYFMRIMKDQRIIVYEEFLMLYDFILSQFSEVDIICNNLYMEQYPINLFCNEQTRKGLLIHFSESEDEDDDTEIGDIDKYAEIYIGLREYRGHLLGAYCDNSFTEDARIRVINLFESSKQELPVVQQEQAFTELLDEADYIALVSRVLLGQEDEICVQIANYSGNIERLKSRLAILAENWTDWTSLVIAEPPALPTSFTHRSEYSELLKQYWNHDSFRMLTVYDLNKLREYNQREVVEISQEQIIANLVEQTENCINGRYSRDMFVTAPTGAGKSVMFQIPAIYLAEKYNLLTIVISPLIGLMNDQVKNLEMKNYRYAKTLNSDISPIVKQEIIERVANSEYHILYISPETLLGRSDVEQLIGDRTIGMIVIDEAHIVTTWGKQFRPDYWYLGDHIRKLRKRQREQKGQSFVIASFTATAIFRGKEDMYEETINSLYMFEPITYLGYVRRNDIDIRIDKIAKAKNERNEYEMQKFEEIEKLVERALFTEQKTLIYFPTVALIERCYEELRAKNKIATVATYYGTLNKEKKNESYELFMTGKKLVMLATKAFGMGIDIDDIAVVAHFAPTGNVCDYVQEIGRAARRPDMEGQAYYPYSPRDFRYINQLHGMSAIRSYQLVEVIRKIVEMYANNLRRAGRSFTKRRNAMLLDAENFSYIFSANSTDEDNSINKVKTALLIIEKDFTCRIGFSPIVVRPIPLFSKGFFSIDSLTFQKLNKKFHDCALVINEPKHIYQLNLEKIWRQDYGNISFPQFKYFLYGKKSDDLEFVRDYPMQPALCVKLIFAEECQSLFHAVWQAFRNSVHQQLNDGKRVTVKELAKPLLPFYQNSSYRVESIVDVLISSIDTYRRHVYRGKEWMLKEYPSNGPTKYEFTVAIRSYFSWVEQSFKKIMDGTENDMLYLNQNEGNIREISTVLGILDTLDILSFEMTGGENSQLYIYINQIMSLKQILNAPQFYHNRILQAVSERHMISVKMMTYLFESGFTSDEIWEQLEDYFLGKVPEAVIDECRKDDPQFKI